MADQKPVDSAQIVLDKRNQASPPAGGAACASGACAAGSLGSLVFKVVAVLFVIGNVTALYVLHFVNRPSPTTRFSFSNFEAIYGTSGKVGEVVSLSADSKLRNGAGTTAYLNRASLSDKDITYYEYANVAKLGTSKSTYMTNLLSYRRVKVGDKGDTKESVLTTFTTNLATKAVQVNDVASGNVIADEAIRGIATLSDSSVLVMSVADANWAFKTYVTAASITDNKVSLTGSSKKLVASGSATNYITPLNAKSAVIAYYDMYDMTKDYYQNVQVATLESSGSITLSAATPFGPANSIPNKVSVNWGKPVTISAADGSFAIPYYTADSGLCLTMATFADSKVSAFTTGVCNTQFKPTYYPEGIMLSDSVMLLAFHDAGNNNVLTLVTVYVTATTAVFRSSFVFADVAGAYVFGDPYGFSPDVSLALLSGNRVAVSFLNPSSNGRQSVKLVKYSLDSLSFKEVAPVIPAASSKFTLDVKGSTVKKSVTQRVLAVGTDSVVAVHLGARGAATYQDFALVEAYGAPIGVLRDLDGSKASVAISGKAKDFETKGNGNLVAGQFYYATTAGYVVSQAADTTVGAEVFAAKEDADMLVTADGKIGLATEKDELFVSMAL